MPLTGPGGTFISLNGEGPMQISDIVQTMSAPAEAKAPGPVQLAVVEVAGEWRVLLVGQKLGRFARQAEALQCAHDIAEEARRDGFAVEVLSQSASGENERVNAHAASC